MSSIALDSSFGRSGSRSRDYLIIVLYSAVALGILAGLHTMSGQAEQGASGVELASAIL
jgi:hypothetical protein